MTPKQQYEARKAERNGKRLSVEAEQAETLDMLDRFVVAVERIAEAMECSAVAVEQIADVMHASAPQPEFYRTVEPVDEDE